MTKDEVTLAEIKNLILEMREDQRKENAQLYAIKLVEKIVFGMVGFIVVAVLAAIIGLVVIK
jgi:hypothetical protein